MGNKPNYIENMKKNYQRKDSQKVVIENGNLNTSRTISTIAMYNLEKYKMEQLDANKHSLKNFDSYYDHLSKIIQNRSSMKKLSNYSKLDSKLYYDKETIFNKSVIPSKITDNTLNPNDNSFYSKKQKNQSHDKCLKFNNQNINSKVAIKNTTKKIIQNEENNAEKKSEKRSLFNLVENLKLSDVIEVPSNIRHIKKLKTNFDLFSLFPSEIIIKILLYIIDEYKSLTEVSIYWKNVILSSLDSYFTGLENHLIAINSSNFIFINSFTSTTLYKFESKKCFRLDRIIQFEVNNEISSRTIVLCYLFKYENNHNLYKTQYKFDIVKCGTRKIWIHKEIQGVF